MTTERKPTIEEIISALELHLTPQTEPDHCDPCPYNPTEGTERDTPQTTCQYRLMRDCLDALKQYEHQVNECYFVKDFVEYAIRCDLPDILQDSDDDFVSVRFAFLLGAAFQSYKQQWEE